MIRKMIRTVLYFLRLLLAGDLYERIMEELEDEQDLH